MSHLCLFTSSVPFFMLPSRFVRSCSHDGDGELDDDDDDDDDSKHLNKKLLYEILCHGVDVSRPVNLAAEHFCIVIMMTMMMILMTI